jgi:cobalamin biosynthesis protein CobT
MVWLDSSSSFLHLEELEGAGVDDFFCIEVGETIDESDIAFEAIVDWPEDDLVECVRDGVANIESEEDADEEDAAEEEADEEDVDEADAEEADAEEDEDEEDEDEADADEGDADEEDGDEEVTEVGLQLSPLDSIASLFLRINFIR